MENREKQRMTPSHNKVHLHNIFMYIVPFISFCTLIWTILIFHQNYCSDLLNNLLACTLVTLLSILNRVAGASFLSKSQNKSLLYSKHTSISAFDSEYKPNSCGLLGATDLPHPTILSLHLLLSTYCFACWYKLSAGEQRF